MDIKKLLLTDFNVRFINAMKQFWLDERHFSCIDNPKKNNLLLLLSDCSVSYCTKNGEKITARSGDVVFTPTGSEYTATITKNHPNGFTVGVNFELFGDDFAPVIIDGTVNVFSGLGKNTEFLFNKILLDSVMQTYLKKRILLMEILQALSPPLPEKEASPILLPALNYLSANPDKATSIPDLAKMCNVSEVYFRKKFRQFANASPIEYRNALRLEKAKNMLENEQLSVQEISDALGYSTVSHFIQQFKKRYSVSPFAYKKDYNANNKGQL